MRIVIDCQCLQTNSRYRGIGHYAISLIQQLLSDNKEKNYPHEFILLFNQIDISVITKIKNDLSELMGSNVKIYTINILLDCIFVSEKNPIGNIFNELLYNNFLNQLNIDFVLIISLFEGRDEPIVNAIHDDKKRNYTIGIIGHDLIPLISKDEYLIDTRFSAWYYNKISNLKNAEIVLTVSNSAKLEFDTYLEQYQGKVINSSSACNQYYHNFDENNKKVNYFDIEFIKKIGINKPFIMYSGAADERKNLRSLIQAYSLLNNDIKNKFDIVLVGNYHQSSKQELTNYAKSLNINEQQIKYTGFISLEELNTLYNYCSVFVFPSLHEGFGLPVLEAMTCGAAVICSNTTSLPEVIDNEVATFNPLNVNEIANLLNKVLTDDNFKNKLIQHNLKKCKEFSWKKSANIVISEIEKLVSENKNIKDNKTINDDFYKHIAEIAVEHKASDKLLRQLANCIAANEVSINNQNKAKINFPTYHWRIEGPFDSSYSLALLNRETARALSIIGQQVDLHSTEGPGDFIPNGNFLKNNPDILALYNNSKNEKNKNTIDVLTRNLYPPRVNDMQLGKLHFLHHYAWEESGFPREFANNFCQYLDGITCLSEHVKKILIDNGITLPLTVSSCGVDHWDRIKASDYNNNVLNTAKKFKFLHVSSCFPRKGVDILLTAYGEAFNINDDVSLIIKTFNNPHHNITEQVEKYKQSNPKFPHVILIIDDLSDGQLKGLYQQCNALVAPSKAEGFGLPIAEAILSNLPVITTAWGGQLDFCNNTIIDGAVALIDYQMENSQTHFNLYESMWAKPDVESLKNHLIDIHKNYDDYKQKISLLADKLREQFSWENVAYNLVSQVQQIDKFKQQIDIKKPLNIGWITTWNTRCGIAAYSKHIIEQNSKDNIIIFAPECDASDLENVDEDNVIRCWKLDDKDSLERLKKIILNLNLDIIVIQSNICFYDYVALTNLILELKNNGIIVTITLHSTLPPDYLPHKNFKYLSKAFDLLDRIMVHSINDVNRLKNITSVDNIALIPLGVPEIKIENINHNNPFFNTNNKIIAAYGFALPHKGLIELLEAFNNLSKKYNNITLLYQNAEHSDPASAKIVEQLKQRINELNLNDKVRIDNRFLTDAESISYLSKADLIVLAYQNTGESSSAAVKMSLASNVPVMVSPIPIFDDVKPAVEFLPGTSVSDIEKGIENFLNGQRQHTDDEVKKWKDEHTFPIVSQRIFNILRSLWINNLLDNFEN